MEKNPNVRKVLHVKWIYYRSNMTWIYTEIPMLRRYMCFFLFRSASLRAICGKQTHKIKKQIKAVPCISSFINRISNES